MKGIFLSLGLLLSVSLFANTAQDLAELDSMVSNFEKLKVNKDKILQIYTKQFISKAKKIKSRSLSQSQKNVLNSIIVKSLSTQALSYEWINDKFSLISIDDALELYTYSDDENLKAFSALLCETDDCKALVKKEHGLCQTDDCAGIVYGVDAFCFTGDCRALISKDKNKCSSKDCRGILEEKSSTCFSSDCKGFVENREWKCYTSICSGIVSEENERCQGNKKRDCMGVSFYLKNTHELNDKEKSDLKKKAWLLLVDNNGKSY